MKLTVRNLIFKTCKFIKKLNEKQKRIKYRLCNMHYAYRQAQYQFLKLIFIKKLSFLCFIYEKLFKRFCSLYGIPKYHA